MENLFELSQFSNLPIFFSLQSSISSSISIFFSKNILNFNFNIVTKKLRHVTFLLLLLLQMVHCKDITENLKQIFPEMKLRDPVPNSYIHISVSDLNNVGGQNVGYKNRSQKHECGNWKRGSAVSFFGIQ
jgi:hypothetical protein